METDAILAAEFETHRPHLRAVAVRILGSDAEADDVVQEAWLRLRGVETDTLEHLGGWLTTVTARLCLDRLRMRSARREEPIPDELSESVAASDPESEALLSDSVGAALSVVLDTLSPPERVAFVLHDVFALAFAEIGEVLGRSPNAAKQLASRARARLRGAPLPADGDLGERRAVVDAFLAASRAGDLAGLVAILDPEIVMRADAAAVGMGAGADVRGADAVAGIFSGRALEARPALVDGSVGIVWAPGDSPRVVWELEIEAGAITRIDMLATPETLADLDLHLD
jgi:RNA polymerase sigma-70 factor (ECF subfamily)